MNGPGRASPHRGFFFWAMQIKRRQAPVHYFHRTGGLCRQGAGDTAAQGSGSANKTSPNARRGSCSGNIRIRARCLAESQRDISTGRLKWKQRGVFCWRPASAWLQSSHHLQLAHRNRILIAVLPNCRNAKHTSVRQKAVIRECRSSAQVNCGLLPM